MSTDSGANATRIDDSSPAQRVTGAKRRGRKPKNVVVVAAGKDGVHRRQALAVECAAGAQTATQQQHDLSDLAVAQYIDDCIIENGLKVRSNYRRERSLMFRTKMRKQRVKIYGDAFHKMDRTVKSINKVLAAKRRQRDGKGKFNLEATATTRCCNTVVFNTYEAEKSHEKANGGQPAAINNLSAIESSFGKGDSETWHGEEPEQGYGSDNGEVELSPLANQAKPASFGWDNLTLVKNLA